MKGKAAKKKDIKPSTKNPTGGEKRSLKWPKQEPKGSAKPAIAVQASPAQQLEIRTDVDKLLDLVKSKGEVPVKELAKELNLPLEVVEEICEALQAHNLLEVNYSIMRGGVARRVANE